MRNPLPVIILLSCILAMSGLTACDKGSNGTPANTYSINGKTYQINLNLYTYYSLEGTTFYEFGLAEESQEAIKKNEGAKSAILIAVSENMLGTSIQLASPPSLPLNYESYIDITYDTKYGLGYYVENSDGETYYESEYYDGDDAHTASCSGSFAVHKRGEGKYSIVIDAVINGIRVQCNYSGNPGLFDDDDAPMKRIKRR